MFIYFISANLHHNQDHLHYFFLIIKKNYFYLTKMSLFPPESSRSRGQITPGQRSTKRGASAQTRRAQSTGCGRTKISRAKGRRTETTHWRLAITRKWSETAGRRTETGDSGCGERPKGLYIAQKSGKEYNKNLLPLAYFDIVYFFFRFNLKLYENLFY